MQGCLCEREGALAVALEVEKGVKELGVKETIDDSREERMPVRERVVQPPHEASKGIECAVAQSCNNDIAKQICNQ